MHKWRVATLIYGLSLLSGALSCNGQGKTSLPEGRMQAQKSAAAYPRLRKTQHSSQYENIHCSLMDKAGNLWFGTTAEGIYRYDGRLFTQFTKQDGLSSNKVWSVLEDTAGSIWIGTDAGLCKYDGKSITAIAVAAPPGSHFLPGIASPANAVWSLMQDKAGTLWLGTTEGVYCYDGKAFSPFLDTRKPVNDSGLTLKSIQCLLQDKAGNIWFGSGPMAFEGLCRYDGQSLLKCSPAKENWIRYIKEDQASTIWLGTRRLGVLRYDGRTFTKFLDGNDIHINSNDKDIGLSALIDKAGNIWLSGGEAANGYGGANGIWRYDGKTLTNFGTTDGLGDYSVWSMVEDRAGNIWIGTRNTGLYRYDGKVFTCFSE